jgi:hypothetical protein
LAYKNLLFVESPFQLLNAYEAIYNFDVKNNYKLVIRLSGVKENDKQLKFLIDYLDLKNVEFVLIKSEKKKIEDYIKIIFYKYKYLLKKK